MANSMDGARRMMDCCTGGRTGPASFPERKRDRSMGSFIAMIFMGQSFLEDKQWADDAGTYPGLLLWWEGLDLLFG